MPVLRSKLKGFVGVNVLALALFSLGIVIAYQYSPPASPQSIVLSHAINNDSGSIGMSGSHSLVTDICVGIVFLVLLVGRKFFLKNRTWSLCVANQLTHWRAFSFTRPPNLRYALTLPQLGVLRI